MKENPISDVIITQNVVYFYYAIYVKYIFVIK